MFHEGEQNPYIAYYKLQKNQLKLIFMSCGEKSLEDRPNSEIINNHLGKTTTLNKLITVEWQTFHYLFLLKIKKPLTEILYCNLSQVIPGVELI